MHLQIKEICLYFEKLIVTNCNYFNIKDYQIYSAEEKQVFINNDTCEENDFIIIPQLERIEIVEKYLNNINNKSLLLKKKNKDFYSKFHWFIEDNHLVDDWNHFEKNELIVFASAWCNQNKINYTIK